MKDLKIFKYLKIVLGMIFINGLLWAAADDLTLEQFRAFGKATVPILKEVSEATGNDLSAGVIDLGDGISSLQQLLGGAGSVSDRVEGLRTALQIPEGTSLTDEANNIIVTFGSGTIRLSAAVADVAADLGGTVYDVTQTLMDRIGTAVPPFIEPGYTSNIVPYINQWLTDLKAGRGENTKATITITLTDIPDAPVLADLATILEEKAVVAYTN